MTKTPIHRFVSRCGAEHFPSPKYSKFSSIVIKREDLSETGSHKFRYLKRKMQKLKEQGHKTVVLSTTGNVGISAAFYGKKLGIKVIALMKDTGDMSRAAQVEYDGALLILTPRPKFFANYISKKYGIPLIRGSRDDIAIECYRGLGEEIREEVPDADAIVNFASSGISSLGLMQAYEGNRSMPALHLVHEPDGKIVHGADLENLVRKTGGKFWTVSEKELRQADQELLTYDLETSWEGASAFAVAKKIKNQYRRIVVIFSGKFWPSKVPVKFVRVTTLKDLH